MIEEPKQYDHRSACKEIAERLNLDEKIVHKTVIAFFSRSGIVAFIVALRRLKIYTFGSIQRTRKTLRIRMSAEYRDRMKKRKYFYKKVRGTRDEKSQIKI